MHKRTAGGGHGGVDAFKNVFLCHRSPRPPWSLGPGITAPPSDMKLSGCCKHQTPSLSPWHFMIPDGKHRSRKLLTCGGHLEIQLCLSNTDEVDIHPQRQGLCHFTVQVSLVGWPLVNHIAKLGGGLHFDQSPRACQKEKGDFENNKQQSHIRI